MKNILVFGCTGQDGSLLCRSLLHQGFNVIGVSRSSNPNLSIHSALKINGEVELVTADLCDFRESLEMINKYGPIEIYNLAAQSSVGLSFKQPVDTFKSIINGTINLLEVSRYVCYDGRLYFAGSSEIFGNTIEPATTFTTRQPLSPYAIAKDASFNTVQVYRQAFNLKCVTGILFNHESPYRSSTFVTRKIVQGALRCAKDPSHRICLGNLNVARDWGWAEEYVDAMQLILRTDSLEDQVICTGRTVTLEYFVDKVFSELGLAWKEFVLIEDNLKRASDINHSQGDPSAMKSSHGWSATSDVDEVIKKLIDAENKTKLH